MVAGQNKAVLRLRQLKSWSLVKHIFDASFRYMPSFDTDVRKTFEKVYGDGRPEVLPYWKYIQQ
jgi:hypothetical protein